MEQHIIQIHIDVNHVFFSLVVKTIWIEKLAQSRHVVHRTWVPKHGGRFH